MTLKIYRGTEAKRASTADVLDAGSLVITDEGNLYISDGVTQARNLVSEVVESFSVSALIAARNPDSIIVGSVTRNSNGVVTSATVKWPDGTTGTYTADTISTIVAAVDSYHITYGSPTVHTYTQPAVTRDSTGSVITLPAIVVT